MTWIDVLAEALNKVTRPVLTLGFGYALIALALKGEVDAAAFMGVAGMAFGFWFKQREDEKKVAAANGATLAPTTVSKSSTETIITAPTPPAAPPTP